MADFIADPAPAATRWPANPAKLLGMTWPLYALMALSFAVQPQSWLRAPLQSAETLAIPLGLPLLGLVFGRRWRLELTPDALEHLTLRKVERFEWRRMGEPELRLLHVLHLPLARTLWFPYPLDAPRTWEERLTARTGRRILLVFGDRPSREVLETVRSWRALALAAAPRGTAPGPEADRP